MIVHDSCMTSPDFNIVVNCVKFDEHIGSVPVEYKSIEVRRLFIFELNFTNRHTKNLTKTATACITYKIEEHFSKTHSVQAISHGMSEFWKRAPQLRFSFDGHMTRSICTERVYSF